MNDHLFGKVATVAFTEGAVVVQQEQQETLEGDAEEDDANVGYQLSRERVSF